jgi:hypothetical protein
MPAYGDVLCALQAAREEMLARSRHLAASSLRGPLPDMPLVVVTIPDPRGLFEAEPAALLATEQIARLGRATNVAVELVVRDGGTLADFGSSLLRSLAGGPSVQVREAAA